MAAGFAAAAVGALHTRSPTQVAVAGVAGGAIVCAFQALGGGI